MLGKRRPVGRLPVDAEPGYPSVVGDKFERGEQRLVGDGPAARLERIALEVVALGGEQSGFVEVPDEEFESMGANVLAIAPRRCVMLDGNPVTRARLEAAGVDVLTYQGSEISVKGGGGPTCLTRPLARR